MNLKTAIPSQYRCGVFYQNKLSPQRTLESIHRDNGRTCRGVGVEAGNIVLMLTRLIFYLGNWLIDNIQFQDL